jgi:hypothetical protein
MAQITCDSCGVTIKQCRDCYTSFCTECLDSDDRCVDCAEEFKKEEEEEEEEEEE